MEKAETKKADTTKKVESVKGKAKTTLSIREDGEQIATTKYPNGEVVVSLL